MLKILSWNIRQGGASRRVQIVNAILELKPDIFVLSEYRNNDHGLYFRSKLLQSGYRFQFVTSSPSDVNSVLIASKMPANCHLYMDGSKEYQDKIILADFDAFNLLGCYLPHKKKHQLFDHLKEVASKEKPGILTGDFNSGKNGIDQEGNSFWYEDELFALEKLGYSDAFRFIHHDIKEYSWYSHKGNGYRYDHFYISNELLPLVKDCYYVHQLRQDKLSDHSPMILELG